MIVCVQFTPTIVPTAKGGHKLLLKLRSVLVVSDAEYTVNDFLSVALLKVAHLSLEDVLFPAERNDVRTLPSSGPSLKRAASPPMWVNQKRRALDFGDVRMREVEKEKDNNGGQPAQATDKVTRAMGSVTIS